MAAEAPMTHPRIRRTSLGLLILLMLPTAFGELGCAAATSLPIVRPASSVPLTDLAKLQLKAGTECLVKLSGGEQLRGACESNSQIGSKCGGGTTFAAPNGSAPFLTQTSSSWRES